MKPIFKKIHLILLPTLILSMNACKPTVIEPSCSAEIISDRSYFMTPQTLSNNCEGVDYIIQGDFIYDVTEDLKVESGVTIQFENGTGLAIKTTGSINAAGNEISPIAFQAETESAIGAWRGLIIFSDNSIM